MVLQKLKFLFSSLVLVAFIGCNENSENSEVESAESNRYQTQIKDYRAELVDGRKNGYLQLVGLMKINEDKMNFGRDSLNLLALNIPRFPEQLGTFSKKDSLIIFETNDGLEVRTANDSILTSIELLLDENGNSEQLFFDDVKFQVITRNEQPYLRVWDAKNPEIEAFSGFEFFPLNKNMLFEADFKYYNSAKSEKVKSQLGPLASTNFIGEVSFLYDGQKYSMDVGNNGFLMVADQTTGNETYGGGRYMYLDLPESDGKLVLDFNRLYNPPCSFNKYTTCLYPPRQNELAFKVEAGETIERKK